MIKGRSEIMNDITEDERNIFWKWFNGFYDNSTGSAPFISLHHNFVECITGVFRDTRIKVLDVAVGPFNF
jgi:hypothetical protein